MPGSILGNAVVRVEDPELLVGHATYVDNLEIDGVLHLAFVRATVAHGRLGAIDVSEAAAMPGVVAVYTAADLGLPRHHAFFPLNDACARPPLAEDKVRFVGDAVGLVVASSKAEAQDAAEAVVVDYDPLPAAVDAEAALAPDAPLQFESLGSNLAASSVPSAKSGAAADPLASAEVVVRGRFINQRVAVVPMEGNAIAVVPGRDDGYELTVFVATQMPHHFDRLSARIFGVDQGTFRVITPHVGGAFGANAGIAAEHTVAIAVARKLSRPVKWIETRSENLVAMPHGRGQVQYIEMGFTAEG